MVRIIKRERPRGYTGSPTDLKGTEIGQAATTSEAHDAVNRLVQEWIKEQRAKGSNKHYSWTPSNPEQPGSTVFPSAGLWLVSFEAEN